MASIVFQTISLVYLLVIPICTSSLLSHDEECLALFHFKQTVLHQKYNGAGGNTGHVIGLDWSGSSLSGIINSNSTLFKLVHLQVLNLSMNNFVESQIPREIAGLRQLRSLDLSNCGFNGQIPKEISQLIQLSLLDLSGNPLRLQSPGLEYLLKNMTRLQHLHLSEVDLSSSVPNFLANFSSLKSIELGACQLQDEFPSAIFQLQKLIHLNIENNPNLTGSLPLFHNNSLLEHLSLALTGFTGTVPKSISNLNHLTYLDLQMCYFSGPIPGSLPNLTELTHLSLSKNEFTGVVPSLASLSKLTFLALGQNNFKKWCAYGWINKLTKLDVLRLSSMNIQDEILPYLANLTKLTFVSLDRNLIFGRIPTSLMNLTQLTSLDISENHLQGQISSTFLNFKSLWYLNLANNNFSGTVGLDSFFGVNKLEYLILNGNRLSFVTTNNYTNDTLPKLKNLGLSSCNLKEFPAFLRQMKMETLSLDDNEIEGVVPNWLWNNSQETLQMISLQSNSITGFYQHPQFLPWIRLEVFAMSNNQLQGRLPIPPETIVI
ncbi:putative leucine-rich repeat domain superfamily [Helianthus annuus]|nr:putative leucine-rich repeat domain superfamily [Helianthus annuus]KAJ0684277.1 putative leucine-rich repeat domain superfamily [Helianthus annuus]